jgi:hypothetical protein
LAQQLLRENGKPTRDQVVDFLRDFDIWDDDTADEVWYATQEKEGNNGNA